MPDGAHADERRVLPELGPSEDAGQHSLWGQDTALARPVISAPTGFHAISGQGTPSLRLCVKLTPDFCFLLVLTIQLILIIHRFHIYKITCSLRCNPQINTPGAFTLIHGHSI